MADPRCLYCAFACILHRRIWSIRLVQAFPPIHILGMGNDLKRTNLAAMDALCICDAIMLLFPSMDACRIPCSVAFTELIVALWLWIIIMRYRLFSWLCCCWSRHEPWEYARTVYRYYTLLGVDCKRLCRLKPCLRWAWEWILEVCRSLILYSTVRRTNEEMSLRWI